MKKITIRQMTLVSLFAALTAAGAFISIPIGIVPISLQNLFTFLSGMVLGSRLGAFSQLIYILLGAVGLPVFSGFRGGLGILVGPTGGFLIGFVISAYVIGKLIEKLKEASIWSYFTVGLLGAFIIYLTGVIQLLIITRIGIKEAVLVGAIPFLPGDCLKVIIASFLALRLKSVVSLPEV
ncbi:MAG: biotin transporter BioY [Atribacterota bacterium]|jgi:biotin transport system substrate-specific component|nr:biotin transporter BioY [Atribacterota bacterium]MDD5636787.1 biotin transporter BioY [Atribacterota bacterium]